MRFSECLVVQEAVRRSSNLDERRIWNAAIEMAMSEAHFNNDWASSASHENASAIRHNISLLLIPSEPAVQSK